MTYNINISVGLLLLIVLTGCQTQQGDNQIAFSRLTGDYWQVWTMQPDGSKATQVTTSLFDKRYPVWATDSKELLFRTNNSQVFSVSHDTGEESQILASLGWIWGVAPSPEGDKVLLVRLRPGLKDRGDLWLTSLEGTGSKVLVKDTGLQYDPAWSPDGRQIVYISGTKGAKTFELFTVDPNGKSKLRLTKNRALELLPAFSPEGKTIAYVSNITGDHEIWLMDADGSNERQLTDSEGIDTRPCWSPDGSKIMFVSNRSGELQLWFMNSDGSNPQQLTTGSPSIDPSWKRQLVNEKK